MVCINGLAAFFSLTRMVWITCLLSFATMPALLTASPDACAADFR